MKTAGHIYRDDFRASFRILTSRSKFKSYLSIDISCTTIHRHPIFSTRYSVVCKVYTGYYGTREIEHGLCAFTVDNHLTKARGLSLRTGAQTMPYLSLVVLVNAPENNTLIMSRCCLQISKIFTRHEKNDTKVLLQLRQLCRIRHQAASLFASLAICLVTMRIANSQISLRICASLNNCISAVRNLYL